MKIIDSYELGRCEAFSIFRIWPVRQRLKRQWMNDIWINAGCSFYQADNPSAAAVFDPDMMVNDDGEHVYLSDYFAGFGNAIEEDGIRYGFVERKRSEINFR